MWTRHQAQLDALVAKVAEHARLLPALTARESARERARLVACVARGDRAEPRFDATPRKVDRAVWQSLAAARALAASSVSPSLYLRRLDELELDLRLLACLGAPREVRPLAARRFGTGREPVDINGTAAPLRDVARVLLEGLDPGREARTVPARARRVGSSAWVTRPTPSTFTSKRSRTASRSASSWVPKIA